MNGFHLGEYLETCGGTWILWEELSHKSSYIEVPTELATLPSATPAHNFRIALTLVYSNLCAFRLLHFPKGDKNYTV
jgi:hypothetical protein